MRHIDTHTKRLLSDPRTRRAWVIYQLKLQGQSLASIARDAGITRQQPQKALAAPYPKVEAVIAKALGMTPQALFAERYDANGLPNRPMGRPAKGGNTKPKNNTRRNAGNVDGRKAA